MKKIILGLVMLMLTQFVMADDKQTIENKGYRGRYVQMSTSRFGDGELFVVSAGGYLKNILYDAYGETKIKINTSNGLPEPGDFVYITRYKHARALIEIEDGPQRSEK